MKKFLSIICLVLFGLGVLSGVGSGIYYGIQDCYGSSGCSGGGDKTPPQDIVYTIQYTDDQGTHTIETTSGSPYSLENIPFRTGYDFLGLYDSEFGGTQYVSATGASLSVFTDNTNLVLFPRFSPKKYTVVLEYEGAVVNGNRSFTVNYGSNIVELPINLQLTNKTFVGWFTEPNCGGKMIGDKYGVKPVVSIIDENNFNLDNQYIYLYAGFEGEKHTVTLHYDNGLPSEEIEVEHNTLAKNIVTDARNSEGFAVISWSKSFGGSQIFNEKITKDVVLYSVEWAPCINFNTNGGEEVPSIVARAGDAITLPSAKKENYKFAGWSYNSSITSMTLMPESSVDLTAVWQAKIIFNSNGGNQVAEISEKANTVITLPTPVRSGYIFGGWYTESTQEYTSTLMPETSIKLKAGWYKIKTVSKVILGADTSLYSGTTTVVAYPSLDTWCTKIDVSDILGKYSNVPCQIKGYCSWAREEGSMSEPKYTYLDFYNKAEVSSANLLSSHSFANTLDYKWDEFSYEGEWVLNSSTIYACYYAPGTSFYTAAMVSDIFVEITYPDMSHLYI